jgi:murein DD-endopeptidase MepM/ murein hydrolase activator NlpD
VASKKITIFFVPGSTNKIKKVSIPRTLAFFFTFIITTCSFYLGWIVIDYYHMKSDMPRLTVLKKQFDLQREQFRHLAKRINEINQSVGKLKEFDRKLKVLANLESGDDNMQFQNVGGSDPGLLSPENTLAKAHEELIRSMHRALDNIEDEVAVGERDKTELHQFLQEQKTMLASTPSIWPARGWMSSRFGNRISPFTGRKEFHKGIDIATKMGAPIIAPANGIVSHIGFDRGYGNILTINHGYGIKTRYAHLQKILVNNGQFVKRDQKIALVGNTGRSTGSHLHYEVHLNRVAVNPLNYILN